jgi:pyridoxine 5'-phosphate synthase PdxJ
MTASSPDGAIALGVNIDHVATLRQARRIDYTSVRIGATFRIAT